jgi:hypothetical protein
MLADKKSQDTLLLNTSIDDNSNYNYYYYGSADRNRAMALETLLLLGKSKKAFAMATKLAKDMSSDQWMTRKPWRMDCMLHKFFCKQCPKGIDVLVKMEKVNQLKR